MAKQKMLSEEAAQQKEYSLTFPFVTEDTPKERVMPEGVVWPSPK